MVAPRADASRGAGSKATKTVGYVMEADKDYVFTIRSGSSTTTKDREGAATAESEVRPTREAIENLLPTFIGEIDQVPPQFSAIKVNGERTEGQAERIHLSE